MVKKEGFKKPFFKKKKSHFDFLKNVKKNPL